MEQVITALHWPHWPMAWSSYSGYTAAGWTNWAHNSMNQYSSECWNCSNSVNIWRLLVYMALYWHRPSWQGCHFFGTPCTYTEELIYWSNFVCLSVCLCVQNISKKIERILTKFCGKLDRGHAERNQLWRSGFFCGSLSSFCILCH